MPTAPKPEPTLDSSERLHHASRVIRALKKLPANTQRNLLRVVVDSPELVEPLRALTGILSPLSDADRAAVVQSAVALVGGGE